VQPNGDLTFKEWAPNAKCMKFFGDFNQWNRNEYVCVKDPYGCFTLTIKANANGTPKVPHNTKYKI
jgi:1,4-alpha-glucan branching enzyme